MTNFKTQIFLQLQTHDMMQIHIKKFFFSFLSSSFLGSLVCKFVMFM